MLNEQICFLCESLNLIGCAGDVRVNFRKHIQKAPSEIPKHNVNTSTLHETFIVDQIIKQFCIITISSP